MAVTRHGCQDWPLELSGLATGVVRTGHWSCQDWPLEFQLLLPFSVFSGRFGCTSSGSFFASGASVPLPLEADMRFISTIPLAISCSLLACGSTEPERGEELVASTEEGLCFADDAFGTLGPNGLTFESLVATNDYCDEHYDVVVAVAAGEDVIIQTNQLPSEPLSQAACEAATTEIAPFVGTWHSLLHRWIWSSQEPTTCMGQWSSNWDAAGAPGIDGSCWLRCEAEVEESAGTRIRFRIEAQDARVSAEVQ